MVDVRTGNRVIISTALLLIIVAELRRLGMALAYTILR